MYILAHGVRGRCKDGFAELISLVESCILMALLGAWESFLTENPFSFYMTLYISDLQNFRLPKLVLFMT